MVQSMNARKGTVAPSSVLLALFALCLGLAPARAQSAIPSGTVLEDQFGVSFNLGSAMSGGTLVLAMSAERDAADRLKEWSMALAGKLPAGVRLVLVADLSSIPFFVPKSAVTKQLKEDYPALSILLDWKGVVAKAVGMGKLDNLAEAWSSGKRLARAEGSADASRVAAIVSALR